jgi:hypothetical protein
VTEEVLQTIEATLRCESNELKARIEALQKRKDSTAIENEA